MAINPFQFTDIFSNKRLNVLLRTAISQSGCLLLIPEKKGWLKSAVAPQHYAIQHNQ